MAGWLNLGQNLKVNAKKFPNTLALKDRERSFTYPQTNRRVNKLAHSLLSLGLSKGDKVAVLLENSIEIVEVFLATAKTGIIIVPINFRLVGSEVEYIVENSDAKAIVVHDEFTTTVDPIKANLKNIAADNYIVVGQNVEGYRPYETFIENAPDSEPEIEVSPADTWILIYTSGTTGKPKGVVRSHESHIAFYLINATFIYLGGSAYIHPARSFKPEEILEIVAQEKITFISLIPTHYNLILNASREAKKHDVSSIRKLLCSSAPVRKSMKLAIMDFFPGVELYEGYGSTEAGIVTVLKPEYQLKKLGSIGFETLGTEFVKILDPDGKDVGIGEVGELYSKGPMLFDEYYKLPEKAAASFKNGWFSAGDMATRDEDGFYQIVDRKDNMIITGGENVYPSEIIGSHECVFDCAIVGLPDDKWGEKVAAVVVRKPGLDESTIDEDTIRECCRSQMAGFKRPKEIIFIDEDEMPRTPTGKILHRKLREKFRK